MLAQPHTGKAIEIVGIESRGLWRRAEKPEGCCLTGGPEKATEFFAEDHR